MTLLITNDTLALVSALEKISNARVIECIDSENELIYIVQEGDARLAIGKNGENAKRLTRDVGKNVRIVEMPEDPVNFVRNYLGNGMEYSIELKDDTLLINTDDYNKGRVIGKGGKKVKILGSLLKRHYNLQVKVN
ncbi:MAG: NusA-like transcription termination signal-binding factor [Euryarchaeota archaeon]|jgi:N utilization substance protein A|nr:NusA-like transcription termination signal-binding factor [Euryarchaeota archaeon]|tara:strand:- start:5075 stop:5482 length:408 start_codon:yes stop_codon:yes gene_type:complete